MNKKEIISKIAEKAGLAQRGERLFPDGFVKVVKAVKRRIG